MFGGADHPHTCPAAARLRLLVLLGVLWSFTAHAQITVRLLDYNIHRDIGAADSDIGAQPALAKVVNYLKPDIWTIQELGGNSGFSASVARTPEISSSTR